MSPPGRSNRPFNPAGKELSVYFDKANRMEWWSHIVKSAPKIGVTKIQLESSKLSELEGETRSMVEKMMIEVQGDGRAYE